MTSLLLNVVLSGRDSWNSSSRLVTTGVVTLRINLNPGVRVGRQLLLLFSKHICFYIIKAYLLPLNVH